MSLIQRNEGRSFAMSMLESVAGISSAFFETDGFRTVLENLRESAKGKPAAYAAGMNEIIEKARELAGEAV